MSQNNVSTLYILHDMPLKIIVEEKVEGKKGERPSSFTQEGIRYIQCLDKKGLESAGGVQ